MQYRFKEIRENNDLKQHEIAKKIGMGRAEYANIESEISNIKLKDFLKFCNEFNCSMDYAANLTNNNSHISNSISKIDKSIMADRLRTIENENSKESKDIAIELGITPSAYSNYKNKNMERLMQTLMVKYLAKKYGYSMDWIVGRTDKKFI